MILEQQRFKLVEQCWPSLVFAHSFQLLPNLASGNNGWLQLLYDSMASEPEAALPVLQHPLSNSEFALLKYVTERNRH